ncbi:hypothetical protein HW532_19995 [Kaustia mangrovi]|uniref:Uncharacterized protein n=1 Tax=Kaustia mangrovi TaxID=2593653 RepID=A0A7S8C7E8_9HYPH|nr:DUF6494 family protein [Kaustia mangrovi]QPC44780.1 hypothetical protein HW532_19995 [Kaustia mangrovi]
MDEDKFNMSLRKFLKQVGVTSQREIEDAVRKAGKTQGKVPVKVVLTSEAVGLTHVVEGEIDLGGT